MFPFYNIILASGSPRRKQLLKQIGVNFTTEISGVDETIDLDLSPERVAKYFALEKAKKVSLNFPKKLVIGADTLVEYDGKILGKPKDEKESFKMLRMLSGKTHKVITGVSLQYKDEKVNKTFHETTKVTFNDLSDKYILHYIKTYSPFDKAGSYGIQDWFAVCVRKIDGCFYNVMGLPLSKFWEEINKLR
jgi:septum formation protein